MDKKLFMSESYIGMKNPAKPFPLNTDVGVLKWRIATKDESLMPISSKYTITVTLPLSKVVYMLEFLQHRLVHCIKGISY